MKWSLLLLIVSQTWAGTVPDPVVPPYLIKTTSLEVGCVAKEEDDAHLRCDQPYVLALDPARGQPRRLYLMQKDALFPGPIPQPFRYERTSHEAICQALGHESFYKGIWYQGEALSSGLIKENAGLASYASNGLMLVQTDPHQLMSWAFSTGDPLGTKFPVIKFQNCGALLR